MMGLVEVMDLLVMGLMVNSMVYIVMGLLSLRNR